MEAFILSLPACHELYLPHKPAQTCPWVQLYLDYQVFGLIKQERTNLRTLSCVANQFSIFEFQNKDNYF